MSLILEEFVPELYTKFRKVRKYLLPCDKNPNCGKSAPQKEGQVFDLKIFLEVESSTLSDTLKHISCCFTW